MRGTGRPPLSRADFRKSPYLVIWEVTRACDLACAHCRAQAIPDRAPQELDSGEGEALLDEARRFGRPLLVITGGDPLKRPDLYSLIAYGHRIGLRMTATPSATPLLDRCAITRMKEAGLQRIALSLDFPDERGHDAFRGVAGSYRRTLGAIREANDVGLPVQINTTISRLNRHRIAEMANLLRKLEIVLWSVFFLVPTGRGERSDVMTATQHEEAFVTLRELSLQSPFDIKTTAGQPYRRVLLQGGVSRPGGVPIDFDPGGGDRAPRGVNDGNGIVFISHTGEIYPSGFLPLSAGPVRRDSLVEVYRNSDLFRALRDSSRLKGKCGRCEFRAVCGGSRARAYALTKDPLASDPTCCYRPGTEGGQAIMTPRARSP